MSENSNKLHVILICAALVLATTAAYWQVRGHEFVSLDDTVYVQANQIVLNGLTRQGFIWSFKTTLMGNWHPLTWLSFMFDCHFFTDKAKASHTTNVILHIANSLLLFWVLKRMTGSNWRSGFVAALFALHPLHVESVAWVSERKDVLSMFFWMLTMWAYIRYVRQPTFLKYVPIALFFVLGLMSKAMLITLPFVLLLLDYWPLERLQGICSDSNAETSGQAKHKNAIIAILRLVTEKVPLFALTAISLTISYSAQQSSGALGGVSFSGRIGNAVISYGKYIVMMFWPGKLSVFYPYPSHIDRVQFVLSAFFLLLISVVAILIFHRRRYLTVGWLWYLGTLVPVIGLVKLGGQAIADRYTYVPLTGLFIMISWGAGDIARDKHIRKIIFGLAGVSIVVALGIATWLQAGYWKNSVCLYERALAVKEDNALAHNNLGTVLTKQGRLNDSIEHYRRALQIFPRYDDAIANLGTILIRKGQINEAIRKYREYLTLVPNDSRIHKNLGDALVRQQQIRSPDRYGASLTTQDKHDLDEAIKHYHQAVQLKNNYFEAHYSLAEALKKREYLEAAIEHYRTTLQIKPDHSKARQSLQACLAKQNK